MVPDMVNTEPSVALVVGAGGPTGGPFAWAALDALEQRTGWDPATASEVIGTSAGAFVAARFEEPTAVDTTAVARLHELSNGHTFRTGTLVRPLSAARVIGGRLFARLAPTSRDLAEYRVSDGPYHRSASVVTVERRSARRVQHRLVTADVEAVVRASAAIPFADQPVAVGGIDHVDGATYSANNADLVDGTPDVVVIISPMVPLSGGSITARAHRAQLACEIADLVSRGCAVVAVLPSEEAHRNRRDRERFAPEGATAVARL